MASIADINLTGSAYVSINLGTGLVTGTPLVIQNKGTDSVRIIISATQPISSDKKGWMLQPGKSVLIENESQEVWARSVNASRVCPISAQVYS